MADLTAAAEWTVETDFALLSATQEEAFDDNGLLVFAGSSPGAVNLYCGAKHATARARVERWDARPPEPGPDWEDMDELPWSTVQGAGVLRVGGFDGADPEGPALDVAGLERGRVQVLAAGRYDGDHDTQPEPERWLLRLWPVEEPADVLAGPPRRLAGPPRLAPGPMPPWYAALSAWSLGGWNSVTESGAFREILLAFRRAGRPTGLADAEAAFGSQPPASRPERAEMLRLLGAAAGLPEVATFADALEVMERLRLVARTSDGLLLPNPTPPAVWDVLDLPEEWERGIRTSVLRDQHMYLEGDVLRLVAWGPLTATPRRIAVRLALRTDDVLAALRLVAHTGIVTVEPAVDEADADTVLTVTSARR